MVDVVDACRLAQDYTDKSQYKAAIKEYMSAVAEKLPADQKDLFRSAAMEAVKDILKNFDEYVFYRSQDDTEFTGMLVLCKYEEITPIFYYWKHGLKRVCFS